MVAHDFHRTGNVAAGGAVRPDLYASHDGQVCEHRSDDWYQRGNAGQWRKMPSNPPVEWQLEQQREYSYAKNAVHAIPPDGLSTQ